MNSGTPFDAYSHYYDLLYRDKDYVAEVDYVDALLQRHDVGGPLILEFGAGTGKHGRLLAERGYRVLGIERSPEMVAQVTPTSDFSVELGDICSVQLGRTFDAVLALFHVVSYQVSNADVQAVFDRASEHLQEGGLFLFDIWYSPAVYAQRPEVRVKRMADENIEIVRLAEPTVHPNENRVDVNYTIFARSTNDGVAQILTEKHPMRHFSLPELDLLASSSGLTRLAAEGFLNGSVPSEDSWGVCIVLQKQ